MLGGTIGLTLAAAGCSVLPTQPYLQRRDWPLTISRPLTLPLRQGGRVLLVRTLQAGPGLEARGLRVVQPDGSVKSEFFEQWAVLPAEGVDDDLRRWLAASGRFAAVLAPGSRMRADLVLESELTALNADLRTGTAHAALALVLIDQRTGADRVLLQRTESAEVKLEGTDPPALERAQIAALEAVLQQTETVLATAAGV
jgi:ABC-type uncharacterized transport system auxiliary subunit